MNLDEEITLTDTFGGAVRLPLINLLRIILVKLNPFVVQYLEENTNATINGFFSEWLPGKLRLAKGDSVLL